MLAGKTEVRNALKILEAWIESQMAYRQQPGLSIGIVHDQQLIWSKGYGYSDPEKKKQATPKTLYRIASISKLFTSTAIVQLRDAGKLLLDDPIIHYLTWFRIRHPFPDLPTITIRHLLTHSSGLPREAAFPYWTDFQFPTREQVKRSLTEQEIAFPPETQWKYSNLALALVGEIIAEVSGEPYAEYIHRHILEPLEMRSTSVAIPSPSVVAAWIEWT